MYARRHDCQAGATGRSRTLLGPRHSVMHIMGPRPLLAGVTALGALLTVMMGPWTTAAGAAQITDIAKLERSSPLSAWDETVVWSAYDSQDDVYRLTALVGDTVRTLPVEPMGVPFDADVGPDTSGDPAIVYSRCEDSKTQDRHQANCDVFIYSLRTGAERPIGNANSDASEFEPTLWRGEVAWARTYDGQSSRPFVYRRPLVAPRSRRSQRLPSVPTRNCDQDHLGTNNCATIDRQVEDLELYGRWLALRAQYDYQESVYDSPITELRLSDLLGHRSQSVTLAADFGGEGGHFTSAALAGGHLSWNTSGSTGGKYGPETRYSSTTRVRLSTGRREQLRTNDSDHPSLAGFAATPSSIYRAKFDLTSHDAPRFDDVIVQRLDGLRWARP